MNLTFVNYRRLEMRDRKKLEELLSKENSSMSFLSWQELLYNQYPSAYYDRCLIEKPVLGDDEAWCKYPLGAPEDRRRVAKKLYRCFNRKGTGLVFSGMTYERLQEVRADFGELVSVTEKREGYRYLLSSKEQIEAQGGKFADRRRRLRRFSDSYQWSYVELTKENLSELANVNQLWYSTRTSGLDTAEEEQGNLRYALAHYDELELQGALLYVENKVVAFCIGHRINDAMYCMPFHKSLVEYKDAMVVLLHEFFIRHCSSYEYINDNCDLGSEGLRQFKMKLRPVQMIECLDVRIAAKRRFTAKKLLRTAYRHVRSLLKASK